MSAGVRRMKRATAEAGGSTRASTRFTSTSPSALPRLQPSASPRLSLAAWWVRSSSRAITLSATWSRVVLCSRRRCSRSLPVPLSRPLSPTRASRTGSLGRRKHQHSHSHRHSSSSHSSSPHSHTARRPRSARSGSQPLLPTPPSRGTMPQRRRSTFPPPTLHNRRIQEEERSRGDARPAFVQRAHSQRTCHRRQLRRGRRGRGGGGAVPPGEGGVRVAGRGAQPREGPQADEQLWRVWPVVIAQAHGERRQRAGTQAADGPTACREPQ